MKEYTLHLKEDVERQLARCRSSLRRSIEKKLQGIVTAAEGVALGRSPTRNGPPLRFYVFEGYRVSYEVDAETRRVIVLELRAEFD
jgi:mRNA-degrading endonuclease RelE of RelBE toxin-antitoxin system